MLRAHLLPVTAAGVATLVLAGCGSGGSSGSGYGSSSSSSGAAKPASPTGAAAVRTAKTKLGNVVVDGGGRTLYVFAKDTGPRSTCSGGCAANWPPFTATSAPKAGGGVQASALTLVKRGDGTRQVVLDGHPLYFFKGDASAGQRNGQGVDAFGAKWYVVGPSGASITKSASAPTGYRPPVSGGYG